MGTEEYGKVRRSGTWHRASYVLFEFPERMAAREPSAPTSVPIRTYPYPSALRSGVYSGENQWARLWALAVISPMSHTGAAPRVCFISHATPISVKESWAPSKMVIRALPDCRRM